MIKSCLLVNSLKGLKIKKEKQQLTIEMCLAGSKRVPMSDCKPLYTWKRRSGGGHLYSVELAEPLTSVLGIGSDLSWGILFEMGSQHYWRSLGLQGSLLTVSIKASWRRKWGALEDNSSPYSWPEARMSGRERSSPFSTVAAPRWGMEGLLGIH